ncbi:MULTISPECIES: DUF6400 family protein [unclassified Streptomyces]|jgi:hypothetical protein|uniref:DUF6400 family protein n=1 Tax=unclassified Streptomyces TaxID=2593676 RepID=UPI003D8F6E1B
MAHENTHDHHIFEMDLTADEARRRAEFYTAMGPHWDPITAMADEDAAYRMLYSGLDEHQRQIYDRLVAAGVLPAGLGDARAAD